MTILSTIFVKVLICQNVSCTQTLPIQPCGGRNNIMVTSYRTDIVIISDKQMFIFELTVPLEPNIQAANLRKTTPTWSQILATSRLAHVDISLLRTKKIFELSTSSACPPPTSPCSPKTSQPLQFYPHITFLSIKRLLTGILTPQTIVLSTACTVLYIMKKMYANY